jgi:6-pyruvoyltetrahydropterin/6-carboxytetrahydropterin synthase
VERWSIDIQKEYLKFSAAHFLIFPDGTAERLHGHNYRVYVEIDAMLTRHGLVMDFKRVKPIIRALVDELDEHWLVPGEHEELSVAAPDEDVLVMPMNNISAENLATWVGRELMRRLRDGFGDVLVRKLVCAVEETAGQRGLYHVTDDGAA